jgi:hypothetical protein
LCYGLFRKQPNRVSAAKRGDSVPVPQAWLEFEVDNVEKATADLESRGHHMLLKNKTEP